MLSNENSLSKCGPYSKGRDLVIKIDHHSPRKLLTQKDIVGKLQKWVKGNCAIFALIDSSHFLVSNHYVSGKMIRETLIQNPYLVALGKRIFQLQGCHYFTCNKEKLSILHALIIFKPYVASQLTMEYSKRNYELMEKGDQYKLNKGVIYYKGEIHMIPMIVLQQHFWRLCTCPSPPMFSFS